MTDNTNSVSDDKRRLMQMMLNKKRQTSKAVSHLIPRRDINQPSQLSFAQQRLWFLDELTPGNAAYAFCNIVRFDGDLNIPCLEKSYNEIVSRHENLRTTFDVIEGKPTQIISDYVELSIPFIDISDSDESLKEQKLQELASIEAKVPFSLARGPLIRLTLVKISAEKHAVLQTMHHIVYDGWSLAVLFDELKKLYEAFIKVENSPLKPLEIQYADFAQWQRTDIKTERSEKQLEYWKSILSDQLPTLNLPIDKPRPVVPTYKGEMKWFDLTDSLSSQLGMLAKREDATMFMVMLAGFSILLQRYTGENDIIVGATIANRNRKEIESLIGFFVNSLVMRTDLSEDIDFCQLLEKVKKVASNAYQNQDVPFEKLVEELQPDRQLSQNPIFQVMFALQNTPPPPSDINGMKLTLEEVDSGTAVFDITLSLYQNENGINGYFEYSTELFEESTINRMIESYKTILKSIVSKPEDKIVDLDILPDAEFSKIVQEWNNNTQDVSAEQCLHELVEQQVINNSNANAIIYEGQELSYGELNSRANQLAGKLIDLGVTTDAIVGVCLHRSIDMFVCILAILKAGGAYLPLDPEYPVDRLSYMLEDSQSDLVLTTQILKETLAFKIEKTYCVDLPDESLNQYSNLNLTHEIKSSSLAYIIYTSGSTGKPKGVMIEHKNIVNSTSVRMNYYQNKVTKFLLLSSFSFDSSVAGIFWTLCQGGELHLIENGMERDIEYVANKIQSIGVSHILSLPSVYALLMTVSQNNELDSLNTVIVAGESCPIELVNKHYKSLPSADLFNEYGPTEATVWSTVYKFNKKSEDETVYIGSVIDNSQTYILDKNMKPVPIGVSGEIYLSGKSLARGYLNNAELTAEKFIELEIIPGKTQRVYKTGDLAKYHSDGNIVYLGRIDRQVKIRGYRIELGEIETALLSLDNIVETVVIAKQKSPIEDNDVLDVDEYILSQLASMDVQDAEKLLHDIEGSSLV